MNSDSDYLSDKLLNIYTESGRYTTARHLDNSWTFSGQPGGVRNLDNSWTSPGQTQV